MLISQNGVFVLLVIILLSGYASTGLPCALKHTNDGFVCVCNATFCDTVEPASKPENNNGFVQYTTSKAGKVFEIFNGLFNIPGDGDEGCFITIKPHERYQEIFGFGGSFTDAAGINLASLSKGAQQNLMSAYFGKDGSGYTFGRVPIGGTDFSTHGYTLDDDPDDNLDLKNFKLAPEDYNYKIPYIKMAKEMSAKPLLLIGTAWSAPAWMKTNNRITGFGFLKKEYYRLWAQYHVKFLEAYQSEGIPFWAVTTGNEPLNAYLFFIVKFNSMGWQARDQGTWVANDLGPLLRDSFNSCKIIAMDDQRFQLPDWTYEMLSVDKAKDFVQGFGLHWYYDKAVPASVLSFVHQRHPDKFLISTEASEGFLPWDISVILGSWKRGSTYLDDIIDDLNHHVSAWVDWNLCLNMQGGPNWVRNFVDSAILVDATRDEFYKQPMFYALAHCSKFIHQQAIRIGFETKGRPFYRLPCRDVFSTVALNQDGGVVVVINNRGSSQKKVILVDPIKGKAQINLDPDSFNTILY